MHVTTFNDDNILTGGQNRAMYKAHFIVLNVN
ncbi:hypothetical protein BDEG_27532 [Batrachochytrium dendrobatidis JEL423]|uniref:Uncharacterized protein n=1 Tax=Batrachochytrium dendrobatidis (strain JEL423) TaxID=403673 RepID=A0A177WWL5_BATDL|nr:hypothetical protein BDEG_27532 [Batrachochytrium dendrobatidis JEL423]